MRAKINKTTADFKKKKKKKNCSYLVPPVYGSSDVSGQHSSANTWFQYLASDGEIEKSSQQNKQTNKRIPRRERDGEAEDDDFGGGEGPAPGRAPRAHGSALAANPRSHRPLRGRPPGWYSHRPRRSEPIRSGRARLLRV